MSQTFSNYFIMGMLGVLFQIFVIKYPKLVQQGKVANHPFTFKEYLKNDWYAILGSIISVLIAIWTLDEWLPLNPLFTKYVKWLFIFVGFTGSSIIQAVLSLTNKKIMDVINVKTDIADGKETPMTPKNIQILNTILEKKEEIDDKQ